MRSYGTALGIEYVLIAFVGLLGRAAVAYTIGTSIRRRRRDFAILEALGLTTRQLFQTITWQAVTITAIALVVGGSPWVSRWDASVGESSHVGSESVKTRSCQLSR